MMEEDLLEMAWFASHDVPGVTATPPKNRTCSAIRVLQKRKVFTPIGSFGTTAFVMYAMPVVCALGIIGNIITFIIIKESANRIAGHYYIKMLTILDSLSLLSLLPSMWAVLIVRPYYHYLDPYSETWVDFIMSAWGFCQTRLIVTFFSRTMAIYTIVLFTLERCVQVSRPFLSQRLCTVTNARYSMLGLLVVALGVNLPYIFAFSRFEIPCSGGKIICKATEVFFKVRYFKMFLLSVLPSFIIIVCNAVILVKMRRSAGRLYRQHKLHCSQTEGGDAHDHSEERKQNREITNRLLLVSFAFFFLNMPLFVVTSAHSHSELSGQHFHRSGAWADAFYISLLLFVVNLSINFILYCFTGRTFRMAALSLLRCKLKEMRVFRSALSGGSQGGRRRSSATKSTSVSRSASVSRTESSRSGQRLLIGTRSKQVTEV